MAADGDEMRTFKARTLYKLALSSVASDIENFRHDLEYLPGGMRCDLLRECFDQENINEVRTEFSNLRTFAKAVGSGDKRIKLYKPFKFLMDEGFNIAGHLATSLNILFTKETSHNTTTTNCLSKYILNVGVTVAVFLSETGYWDYAEKCLCYCIEYCDMTDTFHRKTALLCLTKLVHIQTVNCKFEDAENAFQTAMDIVNELRSEGYTVNCSSLHAEKCGLLFALSQYDQAYEWCHKALEEAQSGRIHVQILIDILRQTSKACVVKRKFKKAECLVKQAVYLAKHHCGEDHPKYADTLSDYGFFLLNVDNIHLSVQVYQAAFTIREEVFGLESIHVATTHEDLAYSMYVHEYSSGNFTRAKYHAEKSIKIITKLLPPDHLLLASSKRVKALILEEIAIDCQDAEKEGQLLSEAQFLHLESLDLARKAFGEDNVQTAKHYGNLGRLYQSMRRYKEAEEMHRQAIEIKERLLGQEDYEVALSLGHLASLYNYDMEEYDKAEELYKKSISMGKKLFGDGYSGLEYDYRGLINLYEARGDFHTMAIYHRVLIEWKKIRTETPLESLGESSIDEPLQWHSFIETFLSMPY